MPSPIPDGWTFAQNVVAAADITVPAPVGPPFGNARNVLTHITSECLDTGAAALFNPILSVLDLVLGTVIYSRYLMEITPAGSVGGWSIDVTGHWIGAPGAGLRVFVSAHLAGTEQNLLLEGYCTG